jgi:hypothetical protein
MHSVDSSKSLRRRRLTDTNSKRTRVDPVFGYLQELDDPHWASRLLELAKGLEAAFEPGPFVTATLEYPVPASRERLDWLVEHATELGHEDEKLKEIATRVASSDERLRMLEGTTYADCLIECERAVVWVEGKRRDWLSPGTTWDPERDQLARNLEAAWITAVATDKADFCVLLCHETDLSTAEQTLVKGYRSGQLIGGMQHLDDETRREFSRRIGTVTWREIVETWPALRADPRLADV